MDNDTDRKRQHAMGAPVAPAKTGAQAAIDMAADIDRRAKARRPAVQSDVSYSDGEIQLKLAGAAAALLAGIAVMALSESNICFVAILGFGGFLFSLLMTGRLLKTLTGSIF